MERLDVEALRRGALGREASGCGAVGRRASDRKGVG